MRSLKVAAAAIMLTAAAGCGMRNTTEAVVRPSLVGTWVLNAVESSDPARAVVPEQDRPPLDAMNAGQRGAWIDRDSMRVARAASERAARVVEAVRKPIEQFAISDSAETITLRSDEQNGITIAADGSARRAAWLDGRTVTVKARWVEQRLEIVRRLDAGTTIREYYSRSPGSAKLVVFTIVTGPFDGELTLRRVYDAVPS